MSALLALILGGGQGTKISAIVGAVLLTLATTFIGLKLIEIHELNSKVETQAKQIADLTLDNKILTENNKVLKQNQGTLVDSNQTNYDTAKKLDEERATSKAAIASLAAQNTKSKEALDTLRKTVAALAKDPNNDGPVAEVLKETIRQIQANRDSK
jgi:chromosome segregation ATPase